MLAIERILKCFKGEVADRVPVYPILSGVTRKLVNANYKDWACDFKVTAKALIEAQKKCEQDCIVTLTDLSVEAADFGQELIYPENEAAYPDHNNQYITCIDDYKKIKKIDPSKTPRMSNHIALCKELVDYYKGTVPIIPFVFGPLGILSMLRNQQDLYLDIMDEPETVLENVGLITEVLINYCDNLIDVGVTAIMFDTLFASASIMSPEMWLEFEGVFVKKLAEHVHSRGCMVMIHNCGYKVYFKEQVEMMNPEAISFLHVPNDCEDFADCKRKYGKKTVLIGAIPPTDLPHMSYKEVFDLSQTLIKVFGEGGRFILATGCEYPANLSLDNAMAMLDAAKAYNNND